MQHKTSLIGKLATALQWRHGPNYTTVCACTYSLDTNDTQMKLRKRNITAPNKWETDGHHAMAKRTQSNRVLFICTYLFSSRAPKSYVIVKWEGPCDTDLAISHHLFKYSRRWLPPESDPKAAQPMVCPFSTVGLRQKTSKNQKKQTT